VPGCCTHPGPRFSRFRGFWVFVNTLHRIFRVFEVPGYLGTPWTAFVRVFEVAGCCTHLGPCFSHFRGFWVFAHTLHHVFRGSRLFVHTWAAFFTFSRFLGVCAHHPPRFSCFRGSRVFVHTWTAFLGTF
jgi:hypothetical protein